MSQNTFSKLSQTYHSHLAIVIILEVFLSAILTAITVVSKSEHSVIWPRILQFGVSARTILLVSHLLFRRDKNIYFLSPCGMNTRPLSKLSYYWELGMWYILGMASTTFVYWWIPISDIYYFLKIKYNTALFIAIIVFDVTLFFEFSASRYILWTRGTCKNVQDKFGKAPIKKGLSK